MGRDGTQAICDCKAGPGTSVSPRADLHGVGLGGGSLRFKVTGEKIVSL